MGRIKFRVSFITDKLRQPALEMSVDVCSTTFVTLIHRSASQISVGIGRDYTCRLGDLHKLEVRLELLDLIRYHVLTERSDVAILSELRRRMILTTVPPPASTKIKG